MTDGETTIGDAPNAAFSQLYFDAGIRVVTVGINDYKYDELLLMAREPVNIVTTESFSRMYSIADQILEKSCEVEKVNCDGKVVADGLNSYFMCDSQFCDFKFSLKSDKCVKVYGSRFETKPTD